MAELRRIFKPAPTTHNPTLGPAHCMCLACCETVLALRCQATDPDGIRCGDYKGHRGDHTMLVCTTFLCAEECLRLDGGAS